MLCSDKYEGMGKMANIAGKMPSKSALKKTKGGIDIYADPRSTPTKYDPEAKKRGNVNMGTVQRSPKPSGGTVKMGTVSRSPGSSKTVKMGTVSRSPGSGGTVKMGTVSRSPGSGGTVKMGTVSRSPRKPAGGTVKMGTVSRSPGKPFGGTVKMGTVSRSPGNTSAGTVKMSAVRRSPGNPKRAAPSRPNANQDSTAKQMGLVRGARTVKTKRKYCPVCGKPIYQTDSFKYNDIWWHDRCFKCEDCKKHMTLQQVVEIEQLLYCKRCKSQQMVGAKIAKSKSPSSGITSRKLKTTIHKCPVCNKTAYPTESKKFNDRMYHDNCFKCIKCRIHVTLGNVAMVEGTKEIMCKQCLRQAVIVKKKVEKRGTGPTTSSRLASKFDHRTNCPQCGKAAYKEESHLMNGIYYHKRCFKCKRCNCSISLKKSSVGPEDGFLYCFKCHNHLYFFDKNLTSTKREGRQLKKFAHGNAGDGLDSKLLGKGAIVQNRPERDTSHIGKGVKEAAKGGKYNSMFGLNCTSCKAELEPDAKFCVFCGATKGGNVDAYKKHFYRRKPEAKKKKKVFHLYVCCGEPLEEGAKFCTYCGKKSADMAPQDDGSSATQCSCGAELSPDSKFCSTCGKKSGGGGSGAAASKPTCSGCGEEIDPNAKFCESCGQRV